jgi:transcriptional regulator with XRE-family HTH domain
MNLGDRVKSIRLQQNFTQGDIEERAGLKRCYISRVENGLTVPSVDTLSKFAQAYRMTLYQLLYDGDRPPGEPDLTTSMSASGREARYFQKLTRHLSKMSEDDRAVLMEFVMIMAKHTKHRNSITVSPQPRSE